MSQITKKYKAAPVVRELALRLTGHLRQKNYRGEVAALHHWVKEEIRYIKDIRDVETIQTPVQTLRIGQGDCDDKSTLVASLLESVGHRTRFVAVGFTPDSLSHVFVQTKIGRDWVTVECTENWPLGAKPSGIKKVMIQNN